MKAAMFRVVSWDWREQPDLDRLATALREVSGGTVHLHQVDTGGQEYAIILSDRPLCPLEIDRIWDPDTV